MPRELWSSSAAHATCCKTIKPYKNIALVCQKKKSHGFLFGAPPLISIFICQSHFAILKYELCCLCIKAIPWSEKKRITFPRSWLTIPKIIFFVSSFPPKPFKHYVRIWLLRNYIRSFCVLCKEVYHSDFLVKKTVKHKPTNVGRIALERQAGGKTFNNPRIEPLTSRSLTISIAHLAIRPFLLLCINRFYISKKPYFGWEQEITQNWRTKARKSQRMF